MKLKIILILMMAVILTSCSTREGGGKTALEDQSAQTSAESEGFQEVRPEEDFYADILITYGAEITAQEPGEREYLATATSFYSSREGISSAKDITGNGFYFWYAEYIDRLSQEQGCDADSLFPGKKVKYPTEDGGFGFVADTYEDIITAFFDVEVEDLRGTFLYHVDKNAYIAESGLGIGTRPLITIDQVTDDGKSAQLELSIYEKESNQKYSMVLSVIRTEGNPYAPYQFVSLLPKE